MRVEELKAIARERGLRGYSRLRKAELIALLQNNLQPPGTPALRTRPVGPCGWRPPRPTRGPQPPTLWRPPPPPSPSMSVRFRPDRLRQPELMRRLGGISTPPAPRPPSKQDTEFKPYQLKPKRGTNVEPPVEQPLGAKALEGPQYLEHPARRDPKKLKRMRKSWMS